MSEHRSTLERELERLSPPRIPFDQLARRRDRKRRDQRIRAGVLGLAIAIAVGWLGVNAIRSTPPVPADDSTPRPELRRDGEVLVFEPRATGKGWDLGAQDPETGEVRKIVETDGIVDCPDRERCRNFVKVAEWSSDGRWVAFEVSFASLDGPPLGPCGPTAGVWVKSALGNPRQLTTPCDAPPPGSDIPIEELWKWSPAGARLAYVRVDGETDELFVVDPSDGHWTSLGTADGDVTLMEWSPDGTRVAYADGGSVYAVDVDGGNGRSWRTRSSTSSTSPGRQTAHRSWSTTRPDTGCRSWTPMGRISTSCSRVRTPAATRNGHRTGTGSSTCSPSFGRDSPRMVSLTPRSGRSRRTARTRSRSSTQTDATWMARVTWVLWAMRSRSGPRTERRSPITPAAFGWSRTPTERVGPNPSAGRRVGLVALRSCTGAGMAAGSPSGTLL